MFRLCLWSCFNSRFDSNKYSNKYFVTSKISSVLSGVLTTKSWLPSGDKVSGRTGPLSKATKEDCATARPAEARSANGARKSRRDNGRNIRVLRAMRSQQRLEFYTAGESRGSPRRRNLTPVQAILSRIALNGELINTVSGLCRAPGSRSRLRLVRPSVYQAKRVSPRG